jgi:hypothetical protein
LLGPAPPPSAAAAQASGQGMTGRFGFEAVAALFVQGQNSVGVQVHR